MIYEHKSIIYARGEYIILKSIKISLIIPLIYTPKFTINIALFYLQIQLIHSNNQFSKNGIIKFTALNYSYHHILFKMCIYIIYIYTSLSFYFSFISLKPSYNKYNTGILETILRFI